MFWKWGGKKNSNAMVLVDVNINKYVGIAEELPPLDLHKLMTQFWHSHEEAAEANDAHAVWVEFPDEIKSIWNLRNKAGIVKYFEVQDTIANAIVVESQVDNVQLLQSRFVAKLIKDVSPENNIRFLSRFQPVSDFQLMPGWNDIARMSIVASEFGHSVLVCEGLKQVMGSKMELKLLKQESEKLGFLVYASIHGKKE